MEEEQNGDSLNGKNEKFISDKKEYRSLEAKTSQIFVKNQSSLNKISPIKKIYQDVAISCFFPFYKNIYQYISNYFQMDNFVETNSKSDPSESLEKEKEKNLDNSSFIFPITGIISLNIPPDHHLEFFFDKISNEMDISVLYFPEFIQETLKHSSNLLDSKIITSIGKKILIEIGSKKTILYVEMTDESIWRYTIEIITYIITEIYQKKNNILVILINSIENMKIPSKFANLFHISWKFETPDKLSRKNFIHHIFLNFSEKLESIDYETIANHLEGWSLGAIIEFIKYFINISRIEEQNPKTFFDNLTTADILNILNSNLIFINNYTQEEQRTDSKNQDSNKSGNDYRRIVENTSSFNQYFEEQLYQEAASKNYQDISIILDKLSHGIILEDFERKILANNSFILQKTPQKALEMLNSAREVLDQINENLKLK